MNDEPVTELMVHTEFARAEIPPTPEMNTVSPSENVLAAVTQTPGS